MPVERAYMNSILRLVPLLLIIGANSGCMVRRVSPPGEISPIRCEFIFQNTEREDADRIAAILERYRLEGMELYMSVGDDSIYCELTVPRLETINKMHNDLRRLPQLRMLGPLAGRDAPEIVFAESDAVLKMTYRAVMLEGGIQMTLKLKITPGAQLFYAAEGDREQEVSPLFIEDDGSVSMPIVVQEGQSFVYGRTVLGDIVKCIRIYIYTGDTKEIPLEEYARHVLMKR